MNSTRRRLDRSGERGHQLAQKIATNCTKNPEIESSLGLNRRYLDRHHPYQTRHRVYLQRRSRVVRVSVGLESSADRALQTLNSKNTQSKSKASMFSEYAILLDSLISAATSRSLY